MKFLVVLCAVVACALGDVLRDEALAAVVKSSYDITPEGAYQYNFETGNGIYAQEQGIVKNTNSEYPSIEVKGAFRYTSPEGVPIETSYIADENGFQPSGAHLPVPPPIPEAIARSLQYLASHPPSPAKSF